MQNRFPVREPWRKKNPQVLTNERPHDTRSAVRSRPTSRTQQTSSFSVKLRHDRTITVTTNTIIRVVSLIRCVTYSLLGLTSVPSPTPDTEEFRGFESFFFRFVGCGESNVQSSGFIEIVKGLGAKNVLTETFWPKVLTETFWPKALTESFDRKFYKEPCFEFGGPGLGCAGLGCLGLGWAGLGWAGLGLEMGCGAGLGWARSSGFETEIGLLENGEVVSRSEKKKASRWPAATSNFYLFLSWGFRVQGFVSDLIFGH